MWIMGEVKRGGTGAYGKWYGPLGFAMTPKCCKDSLIRKKNESRDGEKHGGGSGRGYLTITSGQPLCPMGRPGFTGASDSHMTELGISGLVLGASLACDHVWPGVLGGH